MTIPHDAEGKLSWHKAEVERLRSRLEMLERALESVPLPTHSGGAVEFYGRFYEWYEGMAKPALAKAEGREL